MTKLSVFNPPAPAMLPESERTVYLALTQKDSYILLTAVNERGAHQGCGNLMRFYPDGTFLKEIFGEVDGQAFRSR